MDDELHAICRRCHRGLSDQSSQRRGYGPVCIRQVDDGRQGSMDALWGATEDR